MSNNVDIVDIEVSSALKVDSGAQGTCNLYVMIAGDFVDFVHMCATDVEAAGQYNLPIADPAQGGYDSPGGRALGVMEYRKDAYGPGLDEYVMDKLKVYVPTCGDLGAMRAKLDGMRAYARLAYRVRAHADHVEACEQRVRETFAEIIALDAPMWRIFREEGKQHLDGIAASLADIDGFSWSEGKVYKGQCEHTRNDESAQAFVKNGKAFHAYVATNGSVSERDIAAL
jgi:hypothetical protein